MLEKLADLAHETSSERRRELLTGVCDLFLTAETPTREQGDLFGDIVRRVMEDVTTEARAEFAGRVARSDTMPLDVVRQLATDSEITVADPVLRHSSVLSESDLIEIAKQHGQGHLLAISNRTDLSEGITDVLVARGNTAVLRTVSSNETARFSLDGFRQLVDRAARDVTIRSGYQLHQQHSSEQTISFGDSHSRCRETQQRIHLGTLPDNLLLIPSEFGSFFHCSLPAAVSNFSSFLILNRFLETAIRHVLIDLGAANFLAATHQKNLGLFAAHKRT